MAYNDYHVIVYQLLTYLYECLKSGALPNVESMNGYKKDHGINERYWYYVLEHLSVEGLVDGIVLTTVINAPWHGAKITEQIMITPKGIEYLEANSLMRKLRDGSIKIVMDVASTAVTQIFK